VASGEMLNPAKHLEKEHRLNDETDSSAAAKRKRTAYTIKRAFETAAQMEAEHPKKRRVPVCSADIDQNTMEQLYIRWMIVHNMPFSHVRSDSFRAFLEYINPVVSKLLTRSNTAIKEQLMSTYSFEKNRIRTALHATLSSIHLTLDLWTSPNRRALFAIIAHYTDENGTLQVSTIALREVLGQHNGRNLASFLLEVIDDYQTFPHLSLMAIDLLSIPAMSAEPERVFSGAKLTITDQRARLQGTTIEALECLKSWYREWHK
jgi:hypothetical protein